MCRMSRRFWTRSTRPRRRRHESTLCPDRPERVLYRFVVAVFLRKAGINFFAHRSRGAGATSPEEAAWTA